MILKKKVLVHFLEKKGKQFKKIFYFCQEIERKAKVNKVSTSFYHKQTETLELKKQKNNEKVNSFIC